MKVDGCYVNCNGAIVVPDCPDAGGQHSHFLKEDGENYEHFDADKGTYICPLHATENYPASSGAEIKIQMEDPEVTARIEELTQQALRGS